MARPVYLRFVLLIVVGSILLVTMACPPIPVAPIPPTGVTATAGNAQATVTWSAVTGATSYNLYWSTTSGVGAASSKITDVTSPYTHGSLTNGTTYYYVLTAVNAGGESAASAEVSATPVQELPAVPTGATAHAGNAQATVSWSAVTGATLYNLYWSTTSGDGTGGTRIADVTSPFTHGPLANGTTYYYVVTAVNATGESAASTEVSATPSQELPAAPMGVTATAGNAQATVSWSAVTGATSYNLYWSITSGAGTAGIKIAGVTSPYTHGSLTSGTTYYYVVTAVNAVGESAASLQVSADIVGTVAPPTFSLSGGTYQGTQSVTISTAASGATIRYTTDGTIPTAGTGSPCSGAISVSSCLTLKAVALKNGWTDSPVTSATYTIQFHLTVQSTPIGDGSGTMTPSGTIVVNAGAPVDITATPATGSYFFIWSGGSGVTYGNANSASTTVAITCDATISPIFIYREFLYIAGYGGGGTYVYGINLVPSSQFGYLTSIGNYSTSLGAAAAPSGKYLYRTDISSGGVIRADNIDSTTGVLTALPSSPYYVSTDACYPLIVDSSGKYLYAGMETTCAIAGYAIDGTTGVLSAISGSPFASGYLCFSLAIYPARNYLYTSSYNGIYGYSINGSNGALSALSGSPFGGTHNFNPLVVCGNFLYAEDRSSNSISTFAINDISGALSSVGTLSAGLLSLASDPSGKFLYGTNGSSIYAWTVNGSTGSLNAISGSPYSLSSSIIVVDRLGKLLYAFADSGAVRGFKIDSVTGALSLISPVYGGSGLVPYAGSFVHPN